MTDVCGPSGADGGAEPTQTWEITVDRDLCQGHGVCESEAPSVFAVSKDGVLAVLAERPSDAERQAVDAAVKYCPTHALTIVEEGS